MIQMLFFRFASQGFPEISTEDLISENAKQVLEQMKTYGNTVTSQFTSVADNDAAKVAFLNLEKMDLEILQLT
jgi:hypothetical protein